MKRYSFVAILNGTNYGSLSAPYLSLFCMTIDIESTPRVSPRLGLTTKISSPRGSKTLRINGPGPLMIRSFGLNLIQLKYGKAMRELKNGINGHHNKSNVMKMRKVDGSSAGNNKENAGVSLTHFNKILNNQRIPCDPSVLNLIQDREPK